MPHDFVHAPELADDTNNPNDVMFRCTKCDAKIGFSRPGVGLPCAVLNDDATWSVPADADAYLGPCE